MWQYSEQYAACRYVALSIRTLRCQVLSTTTDLTDSNMCCRLSDIMYKITSIKFLEPSEGKEAIVDHCEKVRSELADSIRSLEEEFR